MTETASRAKPAWSTILIALAFAAGLAVRVVSVLARPHLSPAGDPLEYLGQANLLVAGKGWVEPLTYAHTGQLMQTAKLPPLYTLLQALCSLVGWKSFFAHRIWSALLSSTAVPLAGGLGRKLAGPAVGVGTALGVAFYPNLWMSAGIGMSETISPILVLAVLLLAYRLWDRPTLGRALALGVATGFAALARDELLVLLVLILLPIAYLRSPAWEERLRLAGAGVAAALVIIAPWVGFNLSRFQHPVLISDRLGVTLAAANCPASYYGTLTGFWSMQCSAAAVVGVRGDESAEDSVATRRGLDYLSGHAGRLPVVVWARLGRTFGFYKVGQQMDLDIFVEGRPRVWAWTGLWAYYGLVALAPAGLFVLRRRGAPVFPLVAVAADVILVAVGTYGQTRFRATLEPVLVLLATVALVSARGGRRGGPAPPALSGPR